MGGKILVEIIDGEIFTFGVGEIPAFYKYSIHLKHFVFIFVIAIVITR